MLLLFALFCSIVANGATVLPYTDRIIGFSGTSSTVDGDLRTLGMAGAMTGLADSYMASVANPAGLAMTLPSVALQFNSNEVNDGYVQDENIKIKTTNYGFAGRPYPYGFSIGYATPYRESQPYFLTSKGEFLETDVSVSEFTLSGARLFFDQKLSIGLNLVFGSATRRIGPVHFDSTSVSANLGLLYQLPRRWLIGLTYIPKNTFDSQADTSPIPAAVTGMNRPIHQATKISLGVGWIPNRIFRAGFSIHYLGPTEDSALLSNQNRRVGEVAVLQPRLGLNYTLLEYKELKLFSMAGSYYETSRISNVKNRTHYTGGLDLNLWVFNIGITLDRAANYSNTIFSAVVDLVRSGKKADIIPMGYQPERKGMLPDPFKWDDDDLPQPIVENYVDKGQTPNILDIGLKVPGKLRDKLLEVGETLQDTLGNGLNDILSPSTPAIPLEFPAAPSEPH